jgi:hypothetical protein
MKMKLTITHAIIAGTLIAGASAYAEPINMDAIRSISLDAGEEQLPDHHKDVLKLLVACMLKSASEFPNTISEFAHAVAEIIQAHHHYFETYLKAHHPTIKLSHLIIALKSITPRTTIPMVKKRLAPFTKILPGEVQRKEQQANINMLKRKV